MSLTKQRDNAFTLICGDVTAAIAKAGKSLTLSDIWDDLGNEHSLDQLRRAVEILLQDEKLVGDRDSRNRTFYRLPSMQAAVVEVVAVQRAETAKPKPQQQTAASPSPAPARAPAAPKRRGRKPTHEIDLDELCAWVCSHRPMPLGDVLDRYPLSQANAAKRALHHLHTAGRLARTGAKRGARYHAPGTQVAEQHRALEPAPKPSSDLESRVHRLESQLRQIGALFSSLAP